MSKNKKNGLVYSTDAGRMCPNCRQAIKSCTCKSDAQSSATTQGSKSESTIYIHRETKGRKGAGVSLIKGLPLDDKALKLLAKELKKKCGVGGAIKQGIIEIQGDQRDVLQRELESKGWRVKLAGS